jgi:hypothetical protein
MAKSGAARRNHRATDPLEAFLAYLAEIEQAVLNRNWTQLTAALRKRAGSHLPREVREELVLLSRATRDTLRAPVRFLRFQHRMTQLALSGGPLPGAQTELSLEPEPRSRSIRRVNEPGRLAAAREADAEDAESE